MPDVPLQYLYREIALSRYTSLILIPGNSVVTLYLSNAYTGKYYYHAIPL